MLTPSILQTFEKSVLCWLATADASGQPNVSPKEIFAPFGREQILIANIASPQSLRNIRANPKVCVSVLDILVQKGWKLKGHARIVGKKESDFAHLAAPLLDMTGGKFPFNTLFAITIDQVKPIIAPRYHLYPETTEEDQIAAARVAYGI
ncbi:MAG: pyridoxamine 5'-phosphate oxidase family protein [Bacteroidota bacterium]